MNNLVVTVVGIIVLFGFSKARSINDYPSEIDLNLSKVRKTPIQQCNSNLTVVNVQFFSRDKLCTEAPCQIYAGEEVFMVINFKAPNYLENISPEFIINIGSGITIPFDIGQPNACDFFTNTMCPLVKDEPISYKPSFKLPSVLPDKVTASFQFSLVDKSEKIKVICFMLDFSVNR
ncbi:unnamed protein product [Psylliodes chrysocephalus]|uniref:MD-2-related lipid-recognition domain-containing protein n=1 Tax=Psylliodes chrysocephalus TaxID=3402493 RepID=A0A9P0D0A6_9CUCU|nr:unnamed protein product [Psylliodes chrysocephala]